MAITKISPSVVDFDAGITISTTDNTSNLILTSTDADANTGPILELYRNSSSPADNDEIGRIYFYGENDNDEKIEYGLIRGTIVDASDGTEDSALQIYTYSGGGQRNRVDLLAGETVFNEGGHDIDFRIESDSTVNRFLVDAGNDKVLVGSSAARSQASVTPAFQIEGTDYNSSSLGLVSNSNSSTGCFIVMSHNRGTSAGSSTAVNNGDRIGGIWFQAGDGTDIESPVAFMEANIYGDVGSNDTPGLLKFGTTADGSASPTERLAILPSGGIVFNGDRSTADALDDYEKGTFTPGITNSITVSHAAGNFVKIGDVVHFDIQVGNSWSSITDSAQFTLTGLPFPVLGGNCAGTAFARYVDDVHASNAVYVTTNEHLHLYRSGTGGWDALYYSDLNHVSAYFYIQGTYITT